MERKFNSQVGTSTFVVLVTLLIIGVRGQDYESDDALKFYVCMANCIGHDNYQIYDQCMMICGTIDPVPIPSPGPALGPSTDPVPSPEPSPEQAHVPSPGPTPVPAPVLSPGPAPVPSPVVCPGENPGGVEGVHICIRRCYRSYFKGIKVLDVCVKKCRKGSFKCVKNCEADCGIMNIKCRVGCRRKCGSKSHP